MKTQTYPDFWYDKPYYSLDAYCKHTFGKKIYKIALNAGLSCPNRDGTIGKRGCLFCSAGGSGEFAISRKDHPAISDQINAGLSLFSDKKTGNQFIAYFQAYTNTYASVSYLEKIYIEALSHPLICGISIATRPDCLADEVLHLLQKLKRSYPDKFIWIELGLQTIHEKTAVFIRRGYPLFVFDKACHALQELGIPVIVHTILGLPGETAEMMLATVRYLNHCKIFGIKLQLLHVLQKTDLFDLYQAHDFEVLSKEEYLSLIIASLEYLSPDIVVHRLTGDGPKDLLAAPLWSLNKRNVLNSLHKQMREQKTWQGRCLYDTESTYNY